MDISIIVGLFALMGVCYASLTLTGAPMKTKSGGITVPAGHPRGFVADHRAAATADPATSRFSFGNPHPSDHCSVWRPPQ